MNHYYTSNSNLNSDERKVNYTFKGKRINLLSDIGVFSKERVDFGTNVLLNSLDNLDNIHSVLDVGCGYGIIGISIANAYQDKKIVMIDVNDRCIELSKKNIKSNNLKNAFVFESNLYENINENFDMIISNPPVRAGKKIVLGIIEEGYKHLFKGGCMWIVIQKKQGAPSVEKKMEEVFGNVETINREKGYFVFKSIK